MKKLIFQLMVILLLMGSTTFTVSAEGELKLPSISKYYGPLYTPSNNFSFFPDGENILAIGSQNDIGIIQTSTGNMVRKLYNDDYSYNSLFKLNDKGTYFAGSNSSGYDNRLTLFNQFGENIFDEVSIEYQDEKIYGFDQMAFIPDTNILLVTGRTGVLLGLDVEIQKPVFSRKITYDGEIVTSSEYIAIMGDSSILILDTSGNYITTIDSDIKIRTMQFTSNGKQLVLGGDSNQIMIVDVKNNFEQINLTANQFKLNKGEGFKTIDIDSDNKYLVATTVDNGFRMFDFANGNPIVTNLENEYVDHAKISKSGKYIGVNQGRDGTYIYDGRNLKKRIIEINFPDNQKEVELGIQKPLIIIARLANGTTKEIKTGISWTTNDVSTAYVKSGKIISTKKGSVDLKAKYLGFEITTKVKILPDKTSPIIIGTNTISIKKGKSFNPRTGVTAKDIVDGSLTNKLRITGKVNIKKTGTYKVTYTVKDKAGNQTKVIRTMKVVK